MLEVMLAALQKFRPCNNNPLKVSYVNTGSNQLHAFQFIL